MSKSISGLHDPYEDQLAAARYRAERDALAQVMERVADDIERTFLGFEGAEDAPAMRWAREFRAALGSLHAPGFQKSRKVANSLTPHSDVSAYDLLPQEDREAAAWVREHGGLESVKELLDWVVGHCSTKQQLDFDFWLSGRVMHELGFDEDMADRDEVEQRLLARLMPEDCEWPRYEDGEPVRIGDVGLDVHGKRRKCYGVKFTNAGFTFVLDDMGRAWWGNDCGPLEDPEIDPGKRIKRPAPKVLDADGVEIRVGDKVWLVDGGGPYTVKTTTGRLGTVEFEADEWTDAKPCAITHRAPVLAADGEPLEAGQTVWCSATDDELADMNIIREAWPKLREKLTVNSFITDRKGEVWAGFEEVRVYIKTRHLTHTKPEPPDSYLRLYADMAGRNGNERTPNGIDFGEFARRAKALAEKED